MYVSIPRHPHMTGTAHSQPPGKTGLPMSAPARILVLGLLLALAGAYLYQHRPHLYDHARTDLLAASRGLDTYYQDMEQFVLENRQGTEALRETIGWLQKAAASDPQDLAEISSITAALRQWEAQAHSGELSSAQLHSSYQLLGNRVDRLIKKRTRTTGGK
jgi:hypothetical protein